MPDDAHPFDFCQAVKLDNKGFMPGEWDKAEDMAEKLREVGTPKEISDDARDGAELMLELVDDSSDIRDFTQRAKNLDDGDQDKLIAYLDYVKEKCG